MRSPRLKATRFPFSLSVAIGLLVAIGPFADAAPSKWFRQTTARDFEEGEATASMILPSGEVVPGMKTAAVGLDAAFVWCSAKSPDGKTAYFGTGDQGKIFAVDVDGHDTRARQVAALDVAWVTALVARPDGTLIAGTTPGGRLYSVDPKSGRSSLLATLPADHVWTLARDAKSGALYAGTGAPGKVFSISQKGEARPLWDSGDKHVVSLLLEDEHHLLAGTSESAILFRVGIDGRAEALADFDAEEVRAIAKAPDGAATFVAVNDFDRGGSSSSGGTGAKGTRITVATSGSPASAGSLPRPGQRKARAALYRIENDGRIEQVFSIGDGYFTSIVFDEQGFVYLGTGTEGRIFRVAPDRTAALAIDLPERQALTLVRAGKGFLIGTGDVGSVYRAEPAPAGKATYLSRVIDGDFRAHWGLLRWQGTHAIAIESRSGNTARPDATWSAFSRLASPHATADGGAGQIASPTARYLQYRVTFDATDARLGGVAVAYLPQNQRARITEITTGDNASSSSSSGSSAGGLLGGLGGSSSSISSAAPRAHSPIVKLRWKVDNPDGDELVYRLAFREENEAVWRPLGGPDPLSKAEYDWNTEGLPDGTYVVRVVASDERAEPRDRALDAYLVSPPILVDNRKPEVVGLTAHYPFVSGRARDDQSPISSLEYSVDGGEWQVLSPADGINDDLVEAFTVRLPALTPGPHSVAVRAWDGADNVGAASVTVKR